MTSDQPYNSRTDTCKLWGEKQRNSQKISVFIFLFSWRFWRHFVYFFLCIQFILHSNTFKWDHFRLYHFIFSIFTHCFGLLFCWCFFYSVFVTLLKNENSETFSLSFYASCLTRWTFIFFFLVFFCECHFVRCFWGAKKINTIENAIHREKKTSKTGRKSM